MDQQDHITNEDSLKRWNRKPLSEIFTERKLKLAGNILQLPEHQSKTVFKWTPLELEKKERKTKNYMAQYIHNQQEGGQYHMARYRGNLSQQKPMASTYFPMCQRAQVPLKLTNDLTKVRQLSNGKVLQ